MSAVGGPTSARPLRRGLGERGDCMPGWSDESRNRLQSHDSGIFGVADRPVDTLVRQRNTRSVARPEASQSASTAGGALCAGAARRLVNPPLGTRQTGFRLFGNPVQAIESDLTATALVLSDGTTKVVVDRRSTSRSSASTSRCARQRPGQELRVRVAEALGVPVAHVLLNTSHAHSGVALPDYMPDTPEQIALKERFRAVPDRGPRRGGGRGRRAAAAGPARLRLGREHDRRLPARDPRRPRRARRGARSPDRLLRRRDPASTTSTATRSRSSSATRATRSRWGRAPPSSPPTSPGSRGGSWRRSVGGLALFLQGGGGNINPRAGMGLEDRLPRHEGARRARARRRGREGGRGHPDRDTGGRAPTARERAEHPLHAVGARRRRRCR